MRNEFTGCQFFCKASGDKRVRTIPWTYNVTVQDWWLYFIIFEPGQNPCHNYSSKDITPVTLSPIRIKLLSPFDMIQHVCLHEFYFTILLFSSKWNKKIECLSICCYLERTMLNNYDWIISIAYQLLICDTCFH